ncbi:SpoIIE family protein phosphatase [Limibacter armeniacum]|uniref:PP2C family protein-serine/threonine phosphatase n=1 Tax=Limibacter armeniacum TaxID=466084 RepID=UPI002FE52F0A
MAETSSQDARYWKERFEAQQQMLEITIANMQKATLQLSESKAALEKTNHQLQGSISYATRLQQSILPAKTKLDQIFDDYFIFLKPKDQLSGDSYWVHKHNHLKYIAAIDCTGHGIPGAMLTMLVSTALDQLVTGKVITSPSEIIEALDQKIHYLLNNDEQNELRGKNGLDISLCILDESTNTLIFSGTHQQILLLDGTHQRAIKGARYYVGENSSRKTSLKDHQLQYSKGEKLYLFSDGFPDQFSVHGQKYTAKRLKRLIATFWDIPLKGQKKALEMELSNFRGSSQQIDDILVIGVQL